MEHPGLHVSQIKEEQSLEEVQNNIREVTTRLGFACRMQNQPLINQLNMVLEVYQRVQEEMLNEMFGNDGQDAPGKIDVS